MMLMSHPALNSMKQGGDVELYQSSNIFSTTNSYSCSIADPVTSSLVLTGGYHSLEAVSRYTEAGFEASLPSLITGRFWHGCGGFISEAGGGQVLLVTGGVRSDLNYLASTEVLTSGLWREAGLLPVASMMSGLSLDNEVLMFGELIVNGQLHTSFQIISFNRRL